MITAFTAKLNDEYDRRLQKCKKNFLIIHGKIDAENEKPTDELEYNIFQKDADF